MLKIAFCPSYILPLPKEHRFPMLKYELLPEQLLHEGIVKTDNFFIPTPVSEELILSSHDSSYWSKLKSLTLTKAEIRATGFPLSKELIEREVTIAGGSVQAALFALEHGIAFNIAGGTHHAFTDRGEGFCLLNDIAITSNYLIRNKIKSRILVIDLDVHQGNGTASMCRDNPAIFTFSMHGAKNYPHRKEKSDLDCELEDGTEDEVYLKTLEIQLDLIASQFSADFIIYQSGVDVLNTDKLGRLGLTLGGVKARDTMVLEFAKSQNVPVMCCMGGGYSEKVSQIVDAHSQVYRLAQDMYY